MGKWFRLIGLVLGAGLNTPATAFQLAYDDWSGPDKTQHMLGSVYAGAAATQFVRTYTDDPATAVLWGAMIGQMPGLMRETAQGFQSSGFSYKDHAFNVAGAMLGALLQQNNRLHIVTVGSDAMGTGVVIVLRWRF